MELGQLVDVLYLLAAMSLPARAVSDPPRNPVISVNDVTTTAILVTWTAPVTTVDSIVITCTSSSGGVTQTKTVNSGTSSSCDNVTPGALYNVTLYSQTNTQVSASVAAYPNQIVTAPLPPQSITVTALNASEIQVSIHYSYNASTGQCSHFRINYSGNSSGNSSGVEDVSCSPQEFNYYTTVISGLEANELFVFSVTTFSQSDDSSSPPVSAKQSNAVQGQVHTCALCSISNGYSANGYQGYVSTYDESPNGGLIDFSVPMAKIIASTTFHNDSDPCKFMVVVRGDAIGVICWMSVNVGVHTQVNKHRRAYQFDVVSGHVTERGQWVEGNEISGLLPYTWTDEETGLEVEISGSLDAGWTVTSSTCDYRVDFTQTATPVSVQLGNYYAAKTEGPCGIFV